MHNPTAKNQEELPNFIDSQGAHVLSVLHDLAMSRDIELRFARLKSEVRELLQRDGFIDRLGESQIYGNIYEAAADKIPDTNGR